ncbi:DUF4231 domain-containing protein [uncultured Lacinutrix sp.]|uniref:DUF4231 domain-containing protein n=1 Tax=uncultured Lacinutrix sp. TaxID=574032 RepID=UPI00260261A5|nr:DUF4231 domain-containing protein [uncultured Lacinutrix sp.]
MSSENYIKERIDNQIIWYNHESSKNKKWYYRLRILEIVFALAIPFLSNIVIEESSWTLRIISVLGLLIAFIASILSLLKFQENWVEYRSTSENLKSEKLMFLSKSGPYNKDESYQILVQRIEEIITKENSKWYRLQIKSTLK